MMSLPYFIRVCLIGLLLTAAACRSAPPTVSPTQVMPPVPVNTPAPGETQPPPRPTLGPTPTLPRATSAVQPIATLTGSTWLTGAPVALREPSRLEISWQYGGAGPFALWLVNTGADVPDAAYDRILIVDAPGVTSGVSEHSLIAGTYALEVELADGPWQVTVRQLR